MTASSAARKPKALPPGDGDGAPQIAALRSVDGPEPERVPAFSVNGVTYSISTKPAINKALRYMHIARTQGTEAGIDFMLGMLLGEDGYEALMNFDDLTADQLQDVVTIASKIMAGAVEAPKGQR